MGVVNKEFPENELGIAFFEMNEERDAWRVVEHENGLVQAVRNCGRLEKFKNRDEAREFINAVGMQSALNYLLTL